MLSKKVASPLLVEVLSATEAQASSKISFVKAAAQ